MKRLFLSIIILIAVIGSIKLATHFAAQQSDDATTPTDTTAIDSIMENVTPPTPLE